MNRMIGPFHLTKKGIDNYVMTSMPGCFALGSIKNNHFQLQYIGRADECVNYRLKEWIGKFEYFKFAYTMSLREGFEVQCRIYHENIIAGGLMNEKHPSSPVREEIQCPYCHRQGKEAA